MSALKEAILTLRSIVKYSEDEARDEHGRFAGSGGSSIPSHSELMGMSKVSGPLGSQGGEWRQASNGKTYLVKPLLDEKHGHNEVASAAVYREAGVKFPNTGVVKDKNGNSYLVSEKIDGLSQGKWNGNSKLQEAAAKDFGIDALLSHWDVHGLLGDNTLVDQSGNPVRIEAGGAMAYRAMGGEKSSFSPDAQWVEPTSMRTSDQGQLMYGAMTDAQVADSLERAGNIDLNNVQSRWDAMGIPRSTSDAWMQTLQSRQAQIPALVASLRGASKALSALKQARALLKYSEDEARNSKGEWESSDSGSKSESTTGPRTFTSLDKAQEWARQHFIDGNLEKYPKHHGVLEYRDTGYRTINNLLRGKKDANLSEPQWKAEYRQMVKEIKGQMKPIPAGGVVVYRGFQSGKIPLNVGDTFTEKAFSSTTFDKDIASFFANDMNGGGGKLFAIEVPAGVNAMYFGARDKNVQNQPGANEHELLLEPGLKYEVTSKSADVVHLRVVK